jgi:hypothetical protein
MSSSVSTVGSRDFAVVYRMFCRFNSSERKLGYVKIAGNLTREMAEDLAAHLQTRPSRLFRGKPRVIQLPHAR